MIRPRQREGLNEARRVSTYTLSSTSSSGGVFHFQQKKTKKGKGEGNFFSILIYLVSPANQVLVLMPFGWERGGEGKKGLFEAPPNPLFYALLIFSSPFCRTNF